MNDLNNSSSALAYSAANKKFLMWQKLQRNFLLGLVAAVLAATLALVLLLVSPELPSGLTALARPVISFVFPVALCSSALLVVAVLIAMIKKDAAKVLIDVANYRGNNA